MEMMKQGQDDHLDDDLAELDSPSNRGDRRDNLGHQESIRTD